MKVLNTLTDPVYIPKNRYTWYDRFWLKIINDKRDLPFIYLLTKIHIIVLIPALILFSGLLTGWYWWALALVYTLFAQFYFKGRFGLMLHCICHRKLFKKPHQWIHGYITWVICPLFGHAPESYFSHHLGMHHIENNLPDDTSTTMPYQRDSIKHFIKYFLHFFFLGAKETVQYLYYRKRKKLYTRLTVGELTFMLFCVFMCFVNLKATLLIFILPFLFSRLVMVLGNWTQHAFVDAMEPDNIYRSSINCINTKYNSVCWNDGYHVIHHLRPGLHYTELPGEFMKTKDLFARNKALVFDSIHYLHIFFFLITKRYDKLVDNLVNIDNMFSSREEAIMTLKERTRKIRV